MRTLWFDSDNVLNVLTNHYQIQETCQAITCKPQNNSCCLQMILFSFPASNWLLHCYIITYFHIDLPQVDLMNFWVEHVRLRSGGCLDKTKDFSESLISIDFWFNFLQIDVIFSVSALLLIMISFVVILSK